MIKKIYCACKLVGYTDDRLCQPRLVLDNSIVWIKVCAVIICTLNSVC